jgi:hypothetical protein
LLVEAFRQGLREVGLVENRHVVLDFVWIRNEPEIPQAVNELMQRGAKLLIPCGTSASVAAKQQVSTIPILFINVGNPIGVGLVESLARPGHNVTGFSDMHADLSGKYVQFAMSCVRRALAVLCSIQRCPGAQPDAPITMRIAKSRQERRHEKGCFHSGDRWRILLGSLANLDHVDLLGMHVPSLTGNCSVSRDAERRDWHPRRSRYLGVIDLNPVGRASASRRSLNAAALQSARPSPRSDSRLP